MMRVYHRLRVSASARSIGGVIFRSGGSFSIAETSTYYVIQPSPSHFYDLLADLNASFFTSFNNLIGIDFRFVSRWNAAWSLSGDTTNKTAIEWGGYLRGVPDSLYGDVAMVTNLQFPINFAQGKFFQWSKLEAEVFLFLLSMRDIYVSLHPILCGSLLILPHRRR